MSLPLAAPALPLHEAGKYVAGAYLVFLALVLVYVAIMAVKLQRVERDLGEIGALLDQRDGPAGSGAHDDRTPGEDGTAGGDPTARDNQTLGEDGTAGGDRAGATPEGEPPAAGERTGGPHDAGATTQREAV